MPYGVKVLQCLKKLTTSLEIKLVNVMRVLLVRFKYFSGLVYYGFETKKVSETNRESVQSHFVLDMSACLVSRASFRWIDQLAVTLRQRGVPAPLLRIDLNAFYNAGALVMG